MAAKILDGKQLASQIRQTVATDVDAIRSRLGRSPKLVAILATDDPGANLYARLAKKGLR